MSKILELKNISKSYFTNNIETKILDDVSLDLQAGEINVIIGSSGSGKSTLLHIAALLDNEFTGEIHLNQQLVSNKQNQQNNIRLNNFGFIYQFHNLLTDLTALENVMLPLNIAGINNCEHTAKNLLKKFGLAEHLHKLPGEMSGGQQQRVAIARALINQPQIIFADEPTGNLDEENSLAVFNELKNQVKACQAACLIVTHNMELAKLADKAFELKNNRLKLKVF